MVTKVVMSSDFTGIFTNDRVTIWEMVVSNMPHFLQERKSKVQEKMIIVITQSLSPVMFMHIILKLYNGTERTIVLLQCT